jgi:TRAP-type C4-dicarboxylate transport system substrate-binding protein
MALTVSALRATRALTLAGATALAAALAALLMPVPARSAPPAPAPAASVAATGATAAAPQRLRVVGSLANLGQYTRHEEPFWTRELPRLSGGTLVADVVPFDRAGIRGQEMLRLVQVGAVPFGTALLSLSASEDPVLGAADLAGQNADIAALRRTVTAWRPTLEKFLRERYNAELLALYTYPAQVVFCSKPFAALSDLAGRRVRTSSPTQSDLVEALGGLPVRTGFSELMASMKSGNVECAITGAASGAQVGLPEASSHIHAMAINWGLSVLVANAGAWKALSPGAQALLKRELPKMEQAVWADAERETNEGLACVTGRGGCSAGVAAGKLVEVRVTPADEKRRREIFSSVVLPRWVQRCGADCARLWNDTLGPATGVQATAR